jgi:hypothetical protein
MYYSDNFSLGRGGEEGPDSDVICAFEKIRLF